MGQDFFLLLGCQWPTGWQYIHVHSWGSLSTVTGCWDKWWVSSYWFFTTHLKIIESQWRSSFSGDFNALLRTRSNRAIWWKDRPFLESALFLDLTRCFLTPRNQGPRTQTAKIHGMPKARNSWYLPFYQNKNSHGIFKQPSEFVNQDPSPKIVWFLCSALPHRIHCGN